MTAVPMEWTVEGGAQKERGSRVLRVYCAREKTVGRISKVTPQGSKRAEETVCRFYQPWISGGCHKLPSKQDDQNQLQGGWGRPKRQDGDLHVDKLPHLTFTHHPEGNMRVLPHTDAILAERRGSWENPWRKNISIKKIVRANCKKQMDQIPSTVSLSTYALLSYLPAANPASREHGFAWKFCSA